MIQSMRNETGTTEYLLQLLDAQLAEKKSVLLALDGGSCSGKTTLATELSRLRPCAVFHMDDFFLRPHQRTPERLAEPGGNVDRERFLEEVLLPLKRGEPVRHRPYDCRTQSLLPAVETPPAALTVIEGAYSMHPDLAGYYDLSVFLRISPELQQQRLLQRNGTDGMKRFLDLWVPLETRYFEATDAAARCDLILEVEA